MPAVHPEAAHLVEMIRAAGRPPFEEMTPAQARSAYAASRPLLQRPPEEVAESRDLTIAGPAGKLRLRLYRKQNKARRNACRQPAACSWPHPGPRWPPLARRARAADGVKLGCLTDLNGPCADLTGKGSIASIRLAIEDFSKLHPDIPVELVSADFNLKPDTGLAILRRWYDVEGVDAVLDFPMSALALAAVRVLRGEEQGRPDHVSRHLRAHALELRPKPRPVLVRHLMQSLAGTGESPPPAATHDFDC